MKVFLEIEEIEQGIRSIYAGMGHPEHHDRSIQQFPFGDPGRALEIEQAIQDAFANVPRPGRDQSTHSPNDGEVKIWRNEFFPQNIDPADIPPVVVHYAQYHLQFFTPAGRQFYMPALLRGALYNNCSYVVYMLRPPPDMTRFAGEYGGYGIEQKKIIQRFLEHVSLNHPHCSVREAAHDALRRFWAHYVHTPTPSLETPRGRKDEIIDAILEAFASVLYPGDNALRSQNASEGWYIERDFRGLTPFTIPCNVFAFYSDGLLLLSAKGRQYYLPRYVRGALEDLGANVTHGLVSLFLDANDPAYAAEWFDFYSPEQKRAIRDFIEYLHDECLCGEYPDESLARSAMMALNAYWKHA